MVQQVAEQRIRQTVFVRPLGVAEGSIERLLVGLLNLAERALQRLADVARAVAHVTPCASFGNLEPVVLGEPGELGIAIRLGEGILEFLVVHIGDTLEEQQREDVGLEVRSIDRSAQYVGGLPKMGLQLADGNRICVSPVAEVCHHNVE